MLLSLLVVICKLDKVAWYSTFCVFSTTLCRFLPLNIVDIYHKKRSFVGNYLWKNFQIARSLNIF